MAEIKVMSSTRRGFLRSVPFVAGASLTLADLLPSMALAQGTQTNPGSSFELVSAGDLAESIKGLEAKPGTKHLFVDKNFTLDLTVEKATSAKEFEWHEGRDHLFHIIDGETMYELGGNPQNAHSPRAGEFLAPTSDGAARVTLKKGDTLMIRRGTPHKRTTAGSVTFTLTAPMTPVS